MTHDKSFLETFAVSSTELLCLSVLSTFGEQWRTIPGWPAYAVSNWGSVKSYWKREGTRERLRMVIGETGRLLKPAIEPKTGHLHVTLSDGTGKCQKTFKPATLVLMAFDRLPRAGEEARHLYDPEPTNNFRWNLGWGTRSDNMLDKVKHGQHQTSRMTPDRVREIRRRYAAGEDRLLLSREFGVSRPTLFRIATRQSWAHVSD